MNEKLQYSAMLEMPISSVNVTVKPQRKRRRGRKVDDETIKKELIDRVNANEFEEVTLTEQDGETPEIEQADLQMEENLNVPEQISSDTAIVVSKKDKKKKKRSKISIIAVQFAIIGVLIATIFLTSAINTNSGINVFFRNVFGGEQTQVVDQREYTEFSPTLSVTEADFSLQDGVMTLYNYGSVYSSCKGKIASITADDNGKYTVQIEHSLNFKSVIGGLDFVYGDVGSVVYPNLPVGYAQDEGATMCFTGADGSIISDYQIVDNSVVWAV